MWKSEIGQDQMSREVSVDQKVIFCGTKTRDD